MAHPEPAGHEEEEHHGSPWPVIIAVGMGVGYVGIVTASIPVLLAGVVIFGGGAGGWIHQDMQQPSSAFYGLAAAVESRLPQVSARKLGIWLFLATEIMFFSAIIGASWTLRLRTTTLGDAFQGPWAQPGEILNVPLTGLNTFILICSSLTMVEGLAAARRREQRKLRLFLLATLLLGMTFLSIQAFEYQKLYFGEGLTFKTAPFGVNPLYGPTFYAFFFQAEDGIRDLTVTGVQTCALPISIGAIDPPLNRNVPRRSATALDSPVSPFAPATPRPAPGRDRPPQPHRQRARGLRQIGRASCRERV